MTKLLATALLAAASCGCAAPPGADPPRAAPLARAGAAPHYRCDNGTEFTVRFRADAAIGDAGPRGREELPRDAGGATPEQTVYSNTRMRAEFGLGESGREALLRYAQPPQLAHCVRD